MLTRVKCGLISLCEFFVADSRAFADFFTCCFFACITVHKLLKLTVVIHMAAARFTIRDYHAATVTELDCKH